MRAMWRFDGGRTNARIDELQTYYDESVFDSKTGAFKCWHHDYCLGDCSRRPRFGEFYEGQCQHVGTRYDLLNGDDKPLRIVVTGMSYPGERLVTMQKRWRDVVLTSGLRRRVKPRTRTPHAIGTTLALKHILLGAESLDKHNWHSWNDEFLGTVGNPHDHIFNMCAWVNFLLCSGTAANGSSEVAEHPVLRKCFDHYVETLRRLDPNLVIFEAKGWFGRCLKDRDWVGCWKPLQSFPETLGRFTHAGLALDFVACSFCHPSVRNADNWSREPLQPYFENVVQPTLDQALNELGL